MTEEQFKALEDWLDARDAVILARDSSDGGLRESIDAGRARHLFRYELDLEETRDHPVYG